MNINMNLSANASDHGGVSGRQQNQRTSLVINSPTESNASKQPLSFSSTVKASLFPKKEEAIVYPAVDGILIKDYVIETGKKVGPQNIRYVSRMSNNRICIYFSSKQIVDEFIEKEGGVTINNIFVAARKLIMPAKRIIVSNVSPCIPHHVLEEKFKEMNMKLVSPISFLGAGIGLEEYRHVMSFRRQFFIAEESIPFVPPTMIIRYENEESRVFLSDEQLRCYRCKEIGHIAALCSTNPNENDVIIDQTNTRKRPPPSSTEANEEESPTLHGDNINEDRMETINTPESTFTEDTDPLWENSPICPQNEEAVGVSVTEAVNPDDDFVHPKQFKTATKNDSKRIKLQTSTSVESEDFQEIEHLWSDNNSHPLDFINFTEFMRKVKGQNKPLSIARRYTNDIQGLVNLIDLVRPSITVRRTNARCRRLTEALRKGLSSNESPVMSRSSSQESLSSEKSSY